MKKGFVILFLLLILLPGALWLASDVTGQTYDVPLNGYTDVTEKPVLSAQTLSDGSFQRQYAEWFRENIPLRGIMIRNYNSLNYYLANDANRYVGKNGQIFESDQLTGALYTDPSFDLGTDEYRTKMEAHIGVLLQLRRELQKVGKELYLCVMPSKPTLYMDSLQPETIELLPEGYRTPDDYLLKMLEQTDLPYLNARPLAEQHEYPVFTAAAMHYTKNFDQLLCSKLIEELSALTGKNYMQMKLGEAHTYDYYRERNIDSYRALNIWGTPSETYYEYEVLPDPDSTEMPRILFQGTSFIRGIFETANEYHAVKIGMHINRNISIVDGWNNMIPIASDFSDLNLNEWLDNSDIVVLGYMDAEINTLTYGFAEALLECLQRYVPSEPHYPGCFDGSAAAQSIPNYLFGFNKADATHLLYATTNSTVWVTDPAIAENGLEIDCWTWDAAVRNGDTVSVTVNGKLVYENTFYTPWNESFVIPPELLPPSDNGSYEVNIRTSDYYCPAEEGHSDDSRKLAFTLVYLGVKRP